MGCLFAIFAGLFPRAADIILWIARPTMFLAPFNGSWFWPLLGVIFLPFTTLMYVLLWAPGYGITGFDWFWLVLAFVIDLGGIFSSGYANRERFSTTPSATGL